MAEINITLLPENAAIQAPENISVMEILKSYPQLRSKTLVAKLNDNIVDLDTPLNKDSTIKFITTEAPEALDILRHSTSHVMAEAVKTLFPEVKVAIGPSTDEGFYYDFDYERPFTPEDLVKIEEEMNKIIKEDISFEHRELNKQEAKEIFEFEPYKIELIDALPEDEKITIYTQGTFTDLCRGPHIPKTRFIKAFTLLSVAGAYWRGDEKNKMLCRIYGTAFFSKKDLEDHINKLKEAERRDHRKLGKELDLFSTHEEVGAGLIHWHPNGSVVRCMIEDFWRKVHRKWGYQLVYTPHIANEKIYQISGHLENYIENMYSSMEIDGIPFRVKPMNCPGHILIYKTHLRSYRDLPIRYAELGTVYRYERSGVLHGMLRVRGFTQDDSHIFCTQDQMMEEIARVLDLTDFMMKTFGYKYHPYLATRPEKAIGSLEIWEKAEGALKAALEKRNMDYRIDPGGGVFYGPKIDIKLEDALGREWQGPTVQLDFNLPERFDVNYIDANNQKQRVIMLHRVVLGAMERFIGGLIEHYAGAFPTWLSPTQVVLMPISTEQLEYANSVYNTLNNLDFRVKLDERNESLNYKIREAQMHKVPYMIIVGKREVENQNITVRERYGEKNVSMTLDNFIDKLKSEIPVV